MAAASAVPSFYAPVPDPDRADDLWASYTAFLMERNGRLDVREGFERREAHMQDMSRWEGTSSERVDPLRFERNYAKFDGKDVPWAGNPMADTAAPKRIDDNTYENVWKRGGKVTVTAKVSVSKDGKVLTVTQDGTDPEGKKVHTVSVYDRQ